MARTKNFNEQEVLEKALGLFWKKGYHATSIQDLVNHLGINRASMYDTWGDKHKLFLAALKLYRKQHSSALLELIRSENPARDVIKDFMLYAIKEDSDKQKRNGCFILNSTTELADRDEAVGQLSGENRTTVIKVLTAIIDEGKTEGDITSTQNSEDLATYFFSVISGIQLLRQTKASEKMLKNTVNIALSALD